MPAALRSAASRAPKPLAASDLIFLGIFELLDWSNDANDSKVGFCSMGFLG